MKARRKLAAGKLAVGFPAARDEAVLNAGGIRCESVLFDFAEDGGAVGQISFGRLLPAGAIVKRVTTDEITALTSGGSATLMLQAGSTDLLAAAAAFDTDFGGIGELTLADAQGVKLAAAAELNLDIAVAALTAGKVRFFIEYLLPND
jgi:hypothetical protein